MRVLQIIIGCLMLAGCFGSEGGNEEPGVETAPVTDSAEQHPTPAPAQLQEPVLGSELEAAAEPDSSTQPEAEADPELEYTSEPVPEGAPAPEPAPEAEPEAKLEPTTPHPALNSPSTDEAVRFLVQATFGPTPEAIDEVVELGYEDWILQQLDMQTTSYLDRMWTFRKPSAKTITDLFWERAMEADDQLRHRVAYALSQIVVVGAFDIGKEHFGFAHYMDILQEEATGNYGDLIRRVSFNTNMGQYLSFIGNEKADPEKGIEPDENYAREIMQLFTIGTEILGTDGTGTGVETYTLDDVKGLAAVFTGLSWSGTTFENPKAFWEDHAAPMKAFSAYHESRPKTFLGTTIDLGSDPAVSINAALDHLLDHPNVAPFISKQLIQRLVTANPSPDYVERIAQVYEAGSFVTPGDTLVGNGERGDMKAVVAAILLDREARDPQIAERDDFGKLREPVLMFAHWARAFKDDREAGISAGEPTSSGVMHWAKSTKFLNQQAYSPPSVFSHFRPDFSAAGSATQQAGLVSPELQIATTASLPGYFNFLQGALSGHYDTTSWQPDYTEVRLLADDPEGLVDYLDGLMTYGRLTDTSRDRILRALDTIAYTDKYVYTSRQRRLEAALLMVMTSTEFMVQQ